MEDCKNSIIEYFIYLGLEKELIDFNISEITDFKTKEVEYQSLNHRMPGRPKIENLLDIKKGFAKKVIDLLSRSSKVQNALETANVSLKKKYNLNWGLSTCRRYYYEVKNMI